MFYLSDGVNDMPPSGRSKLKLEPLPRSYYVSQMMSTLMVMDSPMLSMTTTTTMASWTTTMMMMTVMASLTMTRTTMAMALRTTVTLKKYTNNIKIAM